MFCLTCATQVLNKLASISSGSRLSTASPTTLPRRSPAPSAADFTNSSSHAVRRRSESISRASGSETERDTSNNAASDSEGHSETPTSATGSHFRTASLSIRRTSDRFESKKTFPEHPSREGSVEPRDEPRSRFRPESRAEDVEAAALAAVAQSRRESPVEARRRQPLPREFLSGEVSFLFSDCTSSILLKLIHRGSLPKPLDVNEPLQAHTLSMTLLRLLEQHFMILQCLRELELRAILLFGS